MEGWPGTHRAPDRFSDRSSSPFPSAHIHTQIPLGTPCCPLQKAADGTPSSSDSTWETSTTCVVHSVSVCSSAWPQPPSVHLLSPAWCAKWAVLHYSSQVLLFPFSRLEIAHHFYVFLCQIWGFMLCIDSCCLHRMIVFTPDWFPSSAKEIFPFPSWRRSALNEWAPRKRGLQQASLWYPCFEGQILSWAGLLGNLCLSINCA